MREQRWTAIVFVLAVLSTVSPAQGDDRGTYNRSVFQDPAFWVVSGAWDKAETGFYLVDILSRSVDHIALSGKVIKTHEAKDFGFHDDRRRAFRPILIQRIQSSGNVEFWLEAGDRILLRLDQDFQVIEELDLRKLIGPKRLVIERLDHWIWTTGGIFGAGVLRQDDRSWAAFFVARPGESPAILEATRKRPGRQYRLLYPLMAANSDGRGGYLILHAPLELRAIEDGRIIGGRQLPQSWQPSDPWDTWPDVIPTVDKLNRLASSTWISHVVDLGRPHILRRGGRNWYWCEAASGAESCESLPTAAADLLAIGGKKRLLFVEKGPVRDVGSQRLLGFFWSDLANSPAERVSTEEKVHHADFVGPRSLWTHSGVWSVEGESFLLVDALNNSLDEYDLEGKLIRQITGKDLGIESFLPTYIIVTAGHYVVESEEGKLYWIDPKTFQLVPSKSVDLVGAKDEHGAQLRSLNSWTISGGQLIGFGTIFPDEATDHRINGYFSLQLDDPTRFKLIYSIADSDSNGNTTSKRRRSYLGHEYIAPLPNGYASILLDDPLRLIRIGTDGERVGGTSFGRESLEEVAREFGDRPWDSWPSKIEVSSIFGSVEKSQLITHVLFFGDSLLFVGRKNRTTWIAEKFSIKDLRSEGRFLLPTTASHLVLALGKTALLMIEKGPVHDLGHQEVKSLVTVPISFLADPKTSPLNLHLIRPEIERHGARYQGGTIK